MHFDISTLRLSMCECVYAHKEVMQVFGGRD